MKRDLDLMREILLKIEARPEPAAKIADVASSEFERYQVEQLVSSGLLLLKGRGDVQPSHIYASGMARYIIPSVSITASGHDYLDAIRDAGIWSKTKEAVRDQGGSVAIEVVKSLAIGFFKKQIEDRTGMKL